MKWRLSALLWLAAACAGQRGQPTAPPPEYEAPIVPAWDAGTPVDPLGNAAEGDWVDEADEAGANEADADDDRP
jgi:hypothetical protein